jgi:PAS domain S-box-containing protein
MHLDTFDNAQFGAVHKDTDLNLVINIFNRILGGNREKSGDIESKEINLILDLIPDGVLISNQFGKVVATNRAYHSLTGYTKEEIVGKNASQIPAVEIPDKTNFWSNILSVLTKGEIDGFEFTYKHADGSKKWGEARAKLFRTGLFNGGAIAVLRDITDRKNREILLEKLNEELRRSNKDLDDYTYAVSHDLKAPLRTIKSFGTFLLEDYSENLDDDGKLYIERMMEATSHMKELIDDLLTFSRVGRMNTDLETVDLEEIMDLIKLDLTSELEDRNGEIIWSNLPKLKIQRIWMRQLLMNLVSNALKFNNSEKPTVWVTYYESANGHKFSVRDNGIGIDPKHHDRIFRIFERLHKQSEYPGTGAGLTICKKIVDYFNGNIWVESKLGEGSVFHFTIPYTMEESNEVLDGFMLRNELIQNS